MPYRIEFVPQAQAQIRALSRGQRSVLLGSIREQLAASPLVETRNRKPMRPNSLAAWELRIGNLRVYYEVDDEEPDVVLVLAVGVKIRNRVVIGGEIIEL